jgi:hypothetical protein
VKAPRWSRAQYTEFCEKHGTVPAPRRKKSVAGRTARRRGKNKTEFEFEAWFKYQHPSVSLLFEAIKLRIDETCWFLPDYWCPELSTFFEVKGPHIFEDAIVKFKAARALHTWCKFQMWQKWKGSWRQIRKLPGDDGGLE